MSDSSPEDIQDIVSNLQTAVISNRILLASSVLWLYDFALTTTVEIQNVWSKSFSFVTLLYLFNRYSFLMFEVIFTYLVFEAPTHSDQYCYSVTFVYDFFQVLAVGTTSALFTLRVYAIYHKALWVLLVLGTVSLARVGLNIYYSLVLVKSSFFDTENFQYTGFLDHGSCLITVDDGDLFARVSLAVSISSLTFDLLIFAFTLGRTWSQASFLRTVTTSSVSMLLLRDGIMYFFFVFASGATSAGFKIAGFARPSQGGEFSFIVTSIDNVLPNILVSRLFLNLKSLDAHDPSMLTTTRVATMKFASNKILGNIGESLREDVSYYDDDVMTYEESRTAASQSRGTISSRRVWNTNTTNEVDEVVHDGRVNPQNIEMVPV